MKLKKFWKRTPSMRKSWALVHKKIGFLLAFFALFFLGLYVGQSSDKIGVVDMSRVYNEARVFQAIRNEQSTIEDEWKNEAIAEREDLEKADKELSNKKRFLKRVEFDRRVAALKSQILDFQNKQMARLDLIRYQAGRIQQQVEQSMKPMIEQVATDKKLDFVLSASNVLYHTKAIDVTDDVVRQLDEAFEAGQLPSLEVNFEEGEV